MTKTKLVEHRITLREAIDVKNIKSMLTRVGDLVTEMDAIALELQNDLSGIRKLSDNEKEAIGDLFMKSDLVGRISSINTKIAKLVKNVRAASKEDF